MAVLLFIFGLIFTVVFGVLSIIIRIVKRKPNLICMVMMAASFIAVIVGFILVPSENSKYVSPDEKSSLASTSQKENTYTGEDSSKLIAYDIDGGESVILQYNNKNILVDAPEGANKSKNIFSELNSHGIKDIDAIVLLSDDDSRSNNAADIITRYNVTEIRYVGENLSGSITDALKAVNSVKGTNSFAKKISDGDKLYDLSLKLKKENSDSGLSFGTGDNGGACILMDAFKSDADNKNNHTLKLTYDSNGYIQITVNVNSNVSEK